MSASATHSPAISVVIPSLGRSTLAQAVESALAQIPAPLEVIVVFDLPEPPADVRLPPGVRTLCSGGVGTSGARNMGMTAAHGDAIALLDDDDYWFPGKLAAQIPVLASARDRGERAVLTSAFVYVSGAGEVVQPGPHWPIEPGQDVADYLFRRRRIRDGGSVLPTGTLLIDGDLVREVKFDERIPIHEDWDWILRARDHGASFQFVPGCFFAYRMRAPGEEIHTSHLWRESAQWAEDRRATLTPREYGDFLLASSAMLAIDAHQRLDALRLMLRALRWGRPGLPAVTFCTGLWLTPRGLMAHVWPWVDRMKLRWNGRRAR